MRLAESQSIPKITSNSYRGRQIRFTLYLRPSTSTGHLEHKDDVLTRPDAGVDTKSSHCSSRTGRPRPSRQSIDTNECVAPESYSTHKDSPAIMHRPITRLPEPAAFAPVMAYTCLSPEACCLYLSAGAGEKPELEGMLLPYQGWDNPSQSGPPCHSCCIYGSPSCVGKRSSDEDLHIYSTGLDLVGEEEP